MKIVFSTALDTIYLKAASYFIKVATKNSQNMLIIFEPGSHSIATIGFVNSKHKIENK